MLTWFCQQLETVREVAMVVQAIDLAPAMVITIQVTREALVHLSTHLQEETGIPQEEVDIQLGVIDIQLVTRQVSYFIK